ncbi:hypothetical protein C8R43DRAFT_975987 [Mycena crocata]|nr:hypothetical protein C8R43DRAFT_975987 [Mycena crocata]
MGTGTHGGMRIRRARLELGRRGLHLHQTEPVVDVGCAYGHGRRSDAGNARVCVFTRCLRCMGGIRERMLMRACARARHRAAYSVDALFWPWRRGSMVVDRAGHAHLSWAGGLLVLDLVFAVNRLGVCAVDVRMNGCKRWERVYARVGRGAVNRRAWCTRRIRRRYTRHWRCTTRYRGGCGCLYTRTARERGGRELVRDMDVPATACGWTYVSALRMLEGRGVEIRVPVSLPLISSSPC